MRNLTTRLGLRAASLHLRLRRRCDDGGHAVEYAIGIGGSAVVMLAVIAALKAGLAHVIQSWLFE